LNFLTWSLKYLNESYIISNTESHLIETLKQLRRSRNTILVQTSRPLGNILAEHQQRVSSLSLPALTGQIESTKSLN